MLTLVKLYRYVSLVMNAVFFIKNKDGKKQAFQGYLEKSLFILKILFLKLPSTVIQ